MVSPSAEIHQRYTPWLAVLFALFAFRVGAQLLQKLYPVSHLPPFEAWQSGAISYKMLFSSQIIIILMMARVIFKFSRRLTQPRRETGIWLLIVGMAYFLFMLFRLIAGLTFAPADSWFGATIPAFFHLILAGFVLLAGHFHFANGSKQILGKSP